MFPFPCFFQLWIFFCGFTPFNLFPNINAQNVEQKLCLGGFLRSRSWPAASHSIPVSPPWSRWPVWTHAPPCRAARPAAVLSLPEVHHYTADSGFLPRRPCCCGYGSSATSKRPLSWMVLMIKCVVWSLFRVTLIYRLVKALKSFQLMQLLCWGPTMRCKEWWILTQGPLGQLQVWAKDQNLIRA